MRSILKLAILAIAPLSAQQGGPTQLVVTYRCPPPRRAAFRQYMIEQGLQRFDRWKQEGIFKDYRFLFNWYVDVDTWDAMAVLSFSDFAAVARWKDIEKASPGGLARDALELAWPLNSYSADLVGHEAADPLPDRSHAIYFVVAYDGDVRDSGIAYAKAFLHEGVLASYSAFSNRYPGGKRWRGLLVLEYKDPDAFGRRDEILAKVRAQLPKPAGEREPVIAESIGH